MTGYENNMTTSMIEYFENLEELLKLQYAPDLTDLVRNSYGFGSIGASEDTRRADEMDRIIVNLRKEYDEKIYQLLKTEKNVTLNKIDEIVQSLGIDSSKKEVSTTGIKDMITHSGATYTTVNDATDEIRKSKWRELASQLPPCR